MTKVENSVTVKVVLEGRSSTRCDFSRMPGVGEFVTVDDCVARVSMVNHFAASLGEPINGVVFAKPVGDDEMRTLLRAVGESEGLLG